mmetsp:Transcript_5182/g.32523  ORF Transcript_5182/g.32523 Transcript_5182/m.32523 type:complete len:241 (-) Transcript_5182:646-1368(-)
MGMPALAMRMAKPIDLSAAVFPPVLGPVMRTPRTPFRMVTSMGTGPCPSSPSSFDLDFFRGPPADRPLIRRGLRSCCKHMRSPWLASSGEEGVLPSTWMPYLTLASTASSHTTAWRALSTSSTTSRSSRESSRQTARSCLTTSRSVWAIISLYCTMDLGSTYTSFPSSLLPSTSPSPLEPSRIAKHARPCTTAGLPPRFAASKRAFLLFSCAIRFLSRARRSSGLDTSRTWSPSATSMAA